MGEKCSPPLVVVGCLSSIFVFEIRLWENLFKPSTLIQACIACEQSTYPAARGGSSHHRDTRALAMRRPGHLTSAAPPAAAALCR